MSFPTACPSCGFDNPPSHRFCGQCGARLGSPDQTYDPDVPRSYTPAHLAQKILTSRTAMEGERKQVTVLFVDVSGFTALSERVDPEQVHELMTRAFDLMLSEVHRYEGTVNQFLGDGIMALFGAPIAHEDHARRAILAALGIRDALEAYHGELQSRHAITFRVRQGLNSGLVVVGSIGHDLRMDYTAVGDTTNVAARLLQAAAPGRIVVSEATRRLSAGHFKVIALDPIVAKGKREPLTAWEIVSAEVGRTRLGIEAERGFTRFVARDAELDILLRAFERAVGGQGQVVVISGEPGIGKSRLIHELRRRLGNRAGWLEGTSLSFGRSFALHPLTDLVRRAIGVQTGETLEAVITRIDESALARDPDFGPSIPFLRYLLHVDPGDPTIARLDPQIRRAEIFRAVRALSLRDCPRQPQICVFEDLQWIDRATEDYLRFFEASVPTHALVLLVTHRPGYVPPFAGRGYTELPIDALTAEASARVATEALGGEALSEELRNVVAAKAEGNPFFVEQIIKTMQERGELSRDSGRWVLRVRLDEISVPDNVQDVIMGRLDRLGDPLKRVLQAAAVIGREFSLTLLECLAEGPARTDRQLQELTALGLLRQTVAAPDARFAFDHALTQEVTYGSLLARRRRELHRQVGLALEDLARGHLPEQYATVAHHFMQAEEWAKALSHLMPAAAQAAHAFAASDALTLYGQALEAAAHLGDQVDAGSVIAAHQARMNLYFVQSEFNRAHEEGERLIARARMAGDAVTEAAGLAAMSLASGYAHQLDRALEEATQAGRIATMTSVKPVLAASHFATAAVHAVRGDLASANDDVSVALTLSESAGDALRQSLSLWLIARLRNWEGAFQESVDLHARSLDIARKHDLLIPLLQGFFGAALALTGKGAYDAAVAAFEEGLRLTEKVGHEIHRLRLLNGLGWLHMELQDWERALELNTRAARDARKRGDAETIANVELNLADVFLARGDFALTEKTLMDVLHMVREPSTSDWLKWRYSQHLFASLADLSLARGDLTGTRNWVNQCLEIADRTRSRKYLLKSWRLNGEIATASRQWDEAESAFRKALAIARDTSNPTQLWLTYAAIGRLHTQTGNAERARQAFGVARKVIAATAEALGDQSLRDALETAPVVREIYRLGRPE
jgi:class 3 adenylate cyclase/tetratricopeptide (TPR) repeat protein